MSATDNDFQVSTTERKVAFATAADTEYKLADGRVRVGSLMHLWDCSRPHISAALPVHAIISQRTAGGKGRAAGCQSHRCLGMSSGPLRRMRQMKLDACALSASCNSYKGLQLSECY